MTNNRRSAYRREVSLSARLILGEETHEVIMENLSLGGAQLAFGQRLTMGQTVQILFHIPVREEPIDVRATVRWSNRQSVGVHFEGLGPAEVWALNKFFESLQ